MHLEPRVKAISQLLSLPYQHYFSLPSQVWIKHFAWKLFLHSSSRSYESCEPLPSFHYPYHSSTLVVSSLWNCEWRVNNSEVPTKRERARKWSQRACEHSLEWIDIYCNKKWSTTGFRDEKKFTFSLPIAINLYANQCLTVGQVSTTLRQKYTKI